MPSPALRPSCRRPALALFALLVGCADAAGPLAADFTGPSDAAIAQDGSAGGDAGFGDEVGSGSGPGGSGPGGSGPGASDAALEADGAAPLHDVEGPERRLDGRVGDGGTDPSPDATSPDGTGSDAAQRELDAAEEDADPPPPRGLGEAERAEALIDALSGGDERHVAALAGEYDGPLCTPLVCVVLSQFAAGAAPAGTLWLRGSFDGWGEGLPMHAAPGLPDARWQLVDAPPADGVVAYKLNAGEQWWRDPSNPYVVFGGFGPDSAIYGAARGRLFAIDAVFSPELGNTRAVWVYLPRPYFDEPERHFPLLVMADGNNVFTNPAAPFGDWQVDHTADALVAAGSIEPVVIAGVTTPNRNAEYLYAPFEIGGVAVSPKLPEYASFVVNTLEAELGARFRLLPPPRRGIAGSSLGGLSSMWIGWHHPAHFEVVLSLSGSYWLGDAPQGQPELPSMREIMEATPAELAPAPSDLRIYLDAGTSSHQGAQTYGADARAYTDWTRNAFIDLGWSWRPEYGPAAGPGLAPANLPADTPPELVPHLRWADPPPPDYAGWGDYLRPELDLLCLVGEGHTHNEAAWRARFGAALRWAWPPVPPQ